MSDQFCLNCGQSLERLQVQTSPAQTAALDPPIPAMDASNLYLIGEQGLLRVGTRFPLVAAPVILGVVLGLLVVVFTGFGSWFAMSVVMALIIGPIIGEYRARRLAGLVGLGHEELASRHGVQTIPWSAIELMRLKGRKLAFKSHSGWVSSTIERTDAARLSQRTASLLDGKFTTVPEEPPRFSPLSRFFLLTAAILIISEGITVAASLTPFSAGEQQYYTNLYNTVEAGLGPTPFQQWAEIFVNNVQVALSGFVPGLGSLFLGFASYNTGRVAQVAAIHFGVSPTEFLVLLFVLPHAWVEELSYPLAGALGYYIFTWRHQSYAEFSNWKTRASTKVVFGFASVALILAIAAALEVSEVPELGLGVFLFWVPVVVGGIYAYRKLKPRLAAALS